MACLCSVFTCIHGKESRHFTRLFSSTIGPHTFCLYLSPIDCKQPHAGRSRISPAGPGPAGAARQAK